MTTKKNRNRIEKRVREGKELVVEEDVKKLSKTRGNLDVKRVTSGFSLLIGLSRPSKNRQIRDLKQ